MKMGVLKRNLLKFIFIFALTIQPHKVWLDQVNVNVVDYFDMFDVPPNLFEAVNPWSDAIWNPIFRTSSLFSWSRTSKFSDSSNWLNRDVACDEDWIRIDPEKIFVGHLDDDLKVNALDLPNDGVLYFGDKRIVIGDKGTWQCEKRKNTEDTFFQPSDTESPNFYDSKNWYIRDIKVYVSRDGEFLEQRVRPRLDVEMLPGAKDHVFIRNISQIFLDYPILVWSLDFDAKIYNTQKLYTMLRSEEGQFRIRLGHEISKTVVADAIEYLRPASDSIEIKPATTMPRNNAPKNAPKKSMVVQRSSVDLGVSPSNTLEPYFTAICALIHCETARQKRICENTVRPFGQCCEQCGALATFRQSVFHYTRAVQVVRRVESELLGDNNEIGVSFIRLNADDSEPTFQLTVISLNDSTNYDESLSYSVLMGAFQEIQRDAIQHALELNRVTRYYDLRVTYSIQRNKIHVGKVMRNLALMLTFILLIALVLRRLYLRNARFRLWLRSHQMSSQRLSRDGLNVAWRRARELVELRRENRRLSVAHAAQTEFPNAAFANVLYEEEEKSSDNDADVISPPLIAQQELKLKDECEKIFE